MAATASPPPAAHELRKFTPSGGAVDLAACRCTAQDGRAEVAIEITDTGIGIPEDELPQLFDRFFRASNATRAEIPGTGLGLSIVRELCKLLGGEVTFVSELGLVVSTGAEGAVTSSVHE